MRPLGPHIIAIRHLMKRGDRTSRSGYNSELWRMVNCRLRARQIQDGDEPDEPQQDMIAMLDIDTPGSHLVADIREMTALCAEAKRLLRISSEDDLQSPARLIQKMEAMIVTTESWVFDEAPDVWETTSLDLDGSRMLEECCNISVGCSLESRRQHPRYETVWYAYIWNFHAACQIMLHEDIVSLSRRILPDQCDKVLVERQKSSVEKLADSILGAISSLVGVTDTLNQQRDRTIGKGMVAGRFLALFSVDVVVKAQLTSDRQTQEARGVIEWIRSSHSLD